MALDYKEAARQTLEAIGGKDNIVSAAHCATRLRLVIANNDKIDKDKLENIVGAKGNFEAAGQLQIIFGTGTVDKVYDEFIAQSGVTAASKAEAKEAAAQQGNAFQRAIKVLSDVFVPIIPAIVASGMLMGIMSAIQFMGTPSPTAAPDSLRWTPTTCGGASPHSSTPVLWATCRSFWASRLPPCLAATPTWALPWARCSLAPTSSAPTAPRPPSPMAP